MSGASSWKVCVESVWVGFRSPGRCCSCYCCSGSGCGPSSSWLSGSDFKSLLVFLFFVFFFSEFDALESFQLRLLGSVSTWFWCLRVWVQRLCERIAELSIRHRKSVEMNFGNLLFVTFTAFTFASGRTPARSLVARTRNSQCCLQGRRKWAIQESKCHFNLQHFSQCQEDSYYPCAARRGGLRGGSLRLQEGSDWVKPAISHFQLQQKRITPSQLSSEQKYCCLRIILITLGYYSLSKMYNPKSQKFLKWSGLNYVKLRHLHCHHSSVYTSLASPLCCLEFCSASIYTCDWGFIASLVLMAVFVTCMSQIWYEIQLLSWLNVSVCRCGAIMAKEVWAY